MVMFALNDPTSEIGRNIRRRRRSRGLTLEGLAGTSGVSVTMLSEVERAVKNPTVKLAWQIARALDCSITDLLAEPSPEVTVVRAAERSTLVDPESGVRRYGMSTELSQRGLEVVWYVLPGGSSSGEMSPNRPGVLELVSVLSGTLTLCVGGEVHELRRGDSITYEPQTVVEYRNERLRPCELLLLSDASRAGRPRPARAS